MLNIRKIVAVYMALLSSVFLNVCQAAPLDKESGEYKQLEAMGYDISPAKEGDAGTTAKNGEASIYIGKDGSSISFSRSFSRKFLSEEDESKLLRIVNQMNLDMSTQVNITKTGIVFSRYNLGPHNAKAFATHIRIIEKTADIWPDYPTLLPLLNK